MPSVLTVMLSWVTFWVEMDAGNQVRLSNFTLLTRSTFWLDSGLFQPLAIDKWTIFVINYGSDYEANNENWRRSNLDLNVLFMRYQNHNWTRGFWTIFPPKIFSSPFAKCKIFKITLSESLSLRSNNNNITPHCNFCLLSGGIGFASRPNHDNNQHIHSTITGWVFS